MTSALFCSKSCYNEFNIPRNRRAHETIRKIQMHQQKVPNNYGIDLTVKIFLQFYEAFGSVEEMKNFANNHTDEYTIFDFDLSNPTDEMYIKNAFLVIMSTVKTLEPQLKSDTVRKTILANELLDSTDYLVNIFESNQQHIEFIDKLLTKITDSKSWYLSLFIRTYPIRSTGAYFHPSLLLLNQSCDPNITLHPFFGKQMVWIVNRPLKRGSQLTNCFHRTYYEDPKGVCRQHLTCVPCKKLWSQTFDQAQAARVVDETIKEILEKFRKKELGTTELIDYVNRFADFINERFDEGKYYSNSDERVNIAIRMSMVKMLAILLSDPFHVGISREDELY